MRRKLPFEEAFREYEHYPETFQRRFCGGRYDEDMTQQARIACYASYQHYDPSKGSLSTFFWNAIRNSVHTAIRSEVKGREREGARVNEWMEAEGANPEEQVSSLALSQEVHRALGTLNPLERDACRLFYYLGMDHSQIAVRLRVGRSSVSNAIRTGTEKLKKELQGCC